MRTFGPEDMFGASGGSDRGFFEVEPGADGAGEDAGEDAVEQSAPVESRQ
jgi:hypothetical protein